LTRTMLSACFIQYQSNVVNFAIGFSTVAGVDGLEPPTAR
jgi:hypothetical protein